MIRGAAIGFGYASVFFFRMLSLLDIYMCMVNINCIGRSMLCVRMHRNGICEFRMWTLCEYVAGGGQCWGRVWDSLTIKNIKSNLNIKIPGLGTK